MAFLAALTIRRPTQVVVPQTNTTETFSSLFGNEFDAEATIPGTNCRISYPSNGFYGFGATVSSVSNDGNKDFPQGVRISPTVSYDDMRGSESVTLDASGTAVMKHGESLRNYVRNIVTSNQNQTGSIDNGTYEVIGGHEYYLWKTRESVTTWDVLTEANGAVLMIRLAYTSNADTDEAKEAYRHNDDLIREILAQLKF